MSKPYKSDECAYERMLFFSCTDDTAYENLSYSITTAINKRLNSR